MHFERNGMIQQLRGRAAHVARLYLGRLFSSLDSDAIFDMYNAMARAGLGRQIMLICSPGK